MARQVVEDHRVTFAQNGDENLLDIGDEALGIDRPLEHKGGNKPLQVRPARNVVVFQ